MYAVRKSRVQELAIQYFKDMGENGYAALNILTDFATRPVGYISVNQSIDSLQNKAGEWERDSSQRLKIDRLVIKGTLQIIWIMQRRGKIFCRVSSPYKGLGLN